ncbi:hypothetical protein EJB05_17497, partial [Eragrostis curvula]
MMIHGPYSKLVFARQRDAKWVILPSPYLFDDIISYYKGRFYAVTKCGTVLIWEPDGKTFRPRIVVPEHSEGDEYFNKYLAESLDGDLVLIWRQHRSCYGGGSDSSSSSSDDDDEDRHNRVVEYVAKPDPTVRFQVFVLRVGCQGSEWKELHTLGGAALFIGYNTAVFFSVNGDPNLQAECIYFTDELLGSCWDLKQGPRDMGVFDMRSKEVKLMPSLVQNSKGWPPPIWVMPSLL